MSQQPTLTEIQEVGEEELLHDSLLRAACGDEFVRDDDEPHETEEEGELDDGMSESEDSHIDCTCIHFTYTSTFVHILRGIALPQLDPQWC